MELLMVDVYKKQVFPAHIHIAKKWSGNCPRCVGTVGLLFNIAITIISILRFISTHIVYYFEDWPLSSQLRYPFPPSLWAT
ncbi:hypothetical protein LMH87_011249 [Akanthomyces muscarius]|uniref:Uncharacterized protein n=1 Tax=Akanthomyces muscarius TaxID=2231603 RepID=A0A9W8UKS4_AKAMU|nr:hypothetical protein LMH87_011249 [Akanthomyces muscarius]KAJ4150501.1 hypothetical protein LMH87_011249 [Akanthomyces muscarius]